MPDEKTTLKTFPKDKFEALAFLYVRVQNLEGKSPAEVLDIYENAYAEIKKAYASKRRFS